MASPRSARHVGRRSLIGMRPLCSERCLGTPWNRLGRDRIASPPLAWREQGKNATGWGVRAAAGAARGAPDAGVLGRARHIHQRELPAVAMENRKTRRTIEQASCSVGEQDRVSVLSRRRVQRGREKSQEKRAARQHRVACSFEVKTSIVQRSGLSRPLRTPKTWTLKSWTWTPWRPQESPDKHEGS